MVLQVGHDDSFFGLRGWGKGLKRGTLLSTCFFFRLSHPVCGCWWSFFSFHLSLESNGLIGSIPPEISALSHLQVLKLYDNALSGSLPLSLFQLTTLSVLDLSRNQFQYELAAVDNHWDALAQLQVLRLGSNRLTGALPLASLLRNLVRLKEFNVTQTLLTGRLHLVEEESKNPPSGGYDSDTTTTTSTVVDTHDDTRLESASSSSLTSLQRLDLSHCAFWFVLPTELGRMVQLKEFRFGNNQFQGSIPTELALLQDLSILSGGNNQLTGSFPWNHLLGTSSSSSASSSSNNNIANHLAVVDLPMNFLTGTIPPEIDRFKSTLQHLNLSSNLLESELPTTLSQLVQLQVLDLSKNQMNGTLPAIFGDNHLPLLQQLHLDHNQFTGTISERWGIFSSLMELTLGHNSLTGSLPTSLSTLQGLIRLDVGDNALTGTLPVVFGGEWSHLVHLHVQNNNFEGSIPADYVGLSSLGTYDMIDCAHCFFFRLYANVQPSHPLLEHRG
jgi:Leucine-rich repeat (LRR) protein